MSRLLSALATLALVTGALTTGVAGAQPTSGLVRDGRLADMAVPSAAVVTGSLGRSQPVRVDVVLGSRDPAAVSALVRALYNPASARYHRFLRPGEFADRYGPTAGSVRAVERWLGGDGLRVESAQGFVVSAGGTAAAAQRALGLTLLRYRTPGGTSGYAPDAAPLVPSALVGAVQAVTGLDSFDGPQPQVRQVRSAPAPAPAGAGAGSPSGIGTGVTNTGCADGDPGGSYLDEQQQAHNYEIDQLVADGLDGSGETIALYEGNAYDSGVSAYMSCWDLDNPVSVVTVGSAVGTGTDTLEADVDLETAAYQAPGAALEVYEGADWTSAIQEMIDQDNAAVVSISYDGCEGSGYGNYFDSILAQAASQGQSVELASGDRGSEGCSGSNQLSVDFPANSPDVTAVGGTTLETDGTGDESTWNNSYGASGGGISTDETATDAQQAITGSSAREVPDLSADAGTPVSFNAGGDWIGALGTSIAAPLVAGLIADRDTGCSTVTGVFATDLYKADAEGQGVYGTAIDNITTGDNDFTGANGGTYAAGTGYNMATGLGSPLAIGLTCAEVTGVSPNSAASGATVTVNGFGLENATIDFGSTPAEVESATATSATVVVPAGVSGSVTVAASDAALGAGTQTATFAVSAVMPATPSAPTATAGVGSATVTVTAPSSGGTPASYTVTAADATSAGRGGQTCTITGASGSCTVTGLTAGDEYSFTAVAENGAGDSASSPASNTVTPTSGSGSGSGGGSGGVVSAPGAPPAPQAVAGNGQATVSVQAAASGGAPAAYVVTAEDQTTPTDGGQTCSVKAASGSCTVTGLDNGDTYVFVAVAANALGTSKPSPASNAVVPVGPPGTPGAPTAVAGSAEATVTVIPPASGGTPTSYTVTAIDGADPAGGGQGCTVTGASGSCTVTGLVDGDAYTFTDAATNAAGTSPLSAASNPVIPFDAAAPAPPAAPTAVAGSQSAKVTVAAPGGSGGSGAAPTSYRVTAHDLTAAAAGADTARPAPGCTIGAASGSCTVGGLADNHRYTFTAVATNAYGSSTPSSASGPVVPEASAADAHARPGAPPSPAVTVGNRSADVTVMPSPAGGHPASYTVATVDLTQALRGGQRCVVRADAGSCTIGGLTDGDRYRFVVTAVNAVGHSPSSASSRIVIPVAVNSGRQRLASLSSQRPATADMNSGWTSNPKVR